MFESEETRIFTACFLSFKKPECLSGDGLGEYTFNMQTGKIRNTIAQELSDGITLNEDCVLDYNINNSIFSTLKNCIKCLCTRPAEFKKFDMVCNVSSLQDKQNGIIIAKDELDNQFLIYYPVSGIRKWEHASNLEFVYRPTKPVKSNAN